VRDEFIESVRMLSRKTGVPEDQIIEAIKEALYNSYVKVVKSENVVIEVKDDELKMYMKKLVVETVNDEVEEISLEEAKKMKKDVNLDDEILIEMNPEEMGRIAAQISQQTIMRNIREREKDIIFEEFKKKEGSIVTGVFQRKTKKSDIIVDLGKVEGILPIERQMPKDRMKIGEKVKVYIKSVERDKKNNNIRILLTRTNPEFVQKLFEMEVPEIINGLIEIKGISREAGERTKIAVYSEMSDIDPVGACVGMRGARIQSIIRELDGEKIDIVRWNEDVAKFIKNILSPIPIVTVKLNFDDKTAIVVVPNDQLSSAIGKNGKNVKLAAILSGWTIDIKSSEDFERLIQAEESRKKLKELFQDTEEVEKEQEIQEEEKEVKEEKVEEKVKVEEEKFEEEEEEEEEEISIEELPDVPVHILKRLKDAGYLTIESILDLSEKDFLKIPGIGKKNAEMILKSLKENVKVVEE